MVYLYIDNNLVCSMKEKTAEKVIKILIREKYKNVKLKCGKLTIIPKWWSCISPVINIIFVNTIHGMVKQKVKGWRWKILIKLLNSIKRLIN